MADLVTLQQYKDFAGLQGVQNDARINVLIDNVSKKLLWDYYSRLRK